LFSHQPTKEKKMLKKKSFDYYFRAFAPLTFRMEGGGGGFIRFSGLIRFSSRPPSVFGSFLDCAKSVVWLVVVAVALPSLAVLWVCVTFDIRDDPERWLVRL
jgi:hypothetical protein